MILSTWGYHIHTASAAHVSGHTTNIQKSQKFPFIRAGPKLLAGFTDVFVIGIVTIWIIARAIPIAIHAKSHRAFLAVTPKITSKNNAVNTTSVVRACIQV